MKFYYLCGIKRKAKAKVRLTPLRKSKRILRN
nr:MAG TPA: hypothetical protein [Caudoviricetes sp.]DAR74241.1 MAG TPA: hypothetical protein [Caudoviricetes sp.]